MELGTNQGSDEGHDKRLLEFTGTILRAACTKELRCTQYVGAPVSGIITL